jgi:hypothetical protein
MKPRQKTGAFFLDKAGNGVYIIRQMFRLPCGVSSKVRPPVRGCSGGHFLCLDGWAVLGGACGVIVVSFGGRQLYVIVSVCCRM